jgi:hypothetical protein
VLVREWNLRYVDYEEQEEANVFGDVFNYQSIGLVSTTGGQRS